jgi:hypothetical protein
MTYKDGNKKNGKHYWLTPPELMEKIIEELGPYFFDPAPFPRPENFDGLEIEWQDKNYVNPPFGGFKSKTGKRAPGVTAWVRKAINEYKKGKKVIFVYPIDKWVFMMLEAGAEIRNMGDVKWLATEDGSQGKGTGRHVAMFILDPERDEIT